jgi:hypothetical protein
MNRAEQALEQAGHAIDGTWGSMSVSSVGGPLGRGFSRSCGLPRPAKAGAQLYRLAALS